MCRRWTLNVVDYIFYSLSYHLIVHNMLFLLCNQLFLCHVHWHGYALNKSVGHETKTKNRTRLFAWITLDSWQNDTSFCSHSTTIHTNTIQYVWLILYTHQNAYGRQTVVLSDITCTIQTQSKKNATDCVVLRSIGCCRSIHNSVPAPQAGVFY